MKKIYSKINMHTGEKYVPLQLLLAFASCAFVVVLLIVSKLESFSIAAFFFSFSPIAMFFSRSLFFQCNSRRLHTAKLCHSSFVCLHIPFRYFFSFFFTLSLYVCICCFSSAHFECPFLS